MNSRSRSTRLSAAIAAALICAGSGAVASAQNRDLTWDSDAEGGVLGQDGGGNWDTSTLNWVYNDGVNPPSNVAWFNGTLENPNPDSATFGNLTNAFVAASPANNIELASHLTVQNLTFGTAANGATYNISDFNGGSLTINGNVTKAAAGGQIQLLLVNNPLTLSAGNHVFALRDSADDVPEMSVNGVIAGAGGVTLDNGAYESWGTLVFNDENTYAGATSVSKGRLVITTSGGLGAATAGTTISGTGRLSIGGAGTTVAGDLTIAEPITITRNTYEAADNSETGNAALIFNNNGTARTHTLTGQLTIDTTDARIRVSTNTLNILGNIVEGPSITPGTGVLTLGGDFAGFVNLTGDNTGIGGGGIRLIGGVQLNVTNENNLGGPTAPLKFEGSATLHPVGGFITSFGSHPINNTTFSGGIDVDENQSFTVDQPLGNAIGDAANPVGNIGKRGKGTLNLNSPINLRGGSTFWDRGIVNVNSTVELASLHLRSPVVNIPTGGSVTAYSDTSTFGESNRGTDGGPDKAELNINGGTFTQAATGDFFLSNDGSDLLAPVPVQGTEGTINLVSGSLVTNGKLHVARNIGAKGTINQSGGTFQLNRTGDFTLVLGSRRGLGTYNLSAGTMTSAGEFFVGQGLGAGNTTEFGTGVFTMTGGTVNQNNWFVVGREGGKGTVDISGGVFNKAGGGNMPIGESQQDNSMTIRGNAQFIATTGEFWVGNGNNNKSTVNVQDTAVLTVPNWFVVGRDGALGTLNITGGTVTRTATNTGNHNYVGQGSQQNSVLNLGGNASLTINGGQFWLGNGGSSKGTMNISGNAVFSETTGTANNNANQNWIAVGRNGTAQGVLNLSENGTLNSSATYNLSTNTGTSFVIGSGATATGTFTQTGGTVNAQSMAVGETGTGTYAISAGSSNILTNLAVGQAGGGNGTFNISGTANVVTGPIEIGHLGTSQGVINLDGGTLTAASVNGGASTGENRVFNFNGGTLKAGADTATFMGSLTAANVKAGGAVIDSNAHNVAITQALLAGAPSGGLTKQGAGTLTLGGVNTYTGGTNVNAGTLVLANGDAAAGGAVTIADGALAQAQASLPKAVTVNTLATNTSGKFDLTDNSMVVKGMSVAAVQAEIVKAFNAGQWNGTGGLTSSTAAVASPAVTAIGFASNGILNRTEFKGVTPLTATDILVKYTYYGDSDLSGQTTLDDYTLFLNGYQTAGTTWVQGDYDYNGLVTLDDFTLFLAGYQQQGAPLSALEALINSTPMSSAERSAMLAAVQAVPEPAGLALLGVAGAGALVRRRRRQ
jgi:autotransporter-associated beta strand protein